MDINEITNILIFKDGFYWLTIHPIIDGIERPFLYMIPQGYNIRNGFEFASDAYAYIASLSPLRESRKNGVHLDMTDEVYDKEEERLKEMGEV